MAALFTPEELAELAAFDAEIDDEPLTNEEIRDARERDKAAKHERKDKKAQKIAENQRAYREANREKYEAHKAYMREYMRKRRMKKGA